MLRELIQNADDAAALTVEIHFETDEVEESQPAGEVEDRPAGEVEESRPDDEVEESQRVGEVRDINKLNVRNTFIGESVQPSLLSRYVSGSSRTKVVSDRRIGRGSEE